jgi:serine phosphatase RsbU (regulator of sigma subunit)
LPERTVEIEAVDGEVFFGTSNGIYTFKDGKFVKQLTSESQFSGVTRQIHRIAYDKKSQYIWLETHLPEKYKFEFGYLKKEKDNSYSWNITPFLPYSDEIIHAIYHDDNGITWFGGSEGLYRYDPNADTHENKSYNTIIRKVTIGMDSAIFNGTYFDTANASSLAQNLSLKSVLPFANNSVIFEFSSLDFTNERAEKFQYFLDGFDKGWSNWKHETKAVYTNLPEGTHVFHVRSKNIFDQVSTEATYEFTVLPPWYRTWWAYILYLLASAGFVWGVVTYTSRGLKAIIRERTAEIVKQKEVIEYKNRNITDSINYAKRIQEAILPSKELMSSRFPESFILYRPKDIVAGDFYWFAEKEGKFIVAACDCTGHGVPGAFMSLISYSLLNEVLLEKNFTNPATALDTMKKGIIKSLGQTGQEGEQKDGMDMSLISLEVILDGSKAGNKLSFAGANNPLYLLRKGELIELTADKMPIGIYMGIERPFVNKEMMLEPGDTIYLFSDGYADQFGGAQGKKFTKKRYKELLISIQNEPMKRQRDILENTMDTWLGEQQQIDDVLVMGIRIS